MRHMRHNEARKHHVWGGGGGGGGGRRSGPFDFCMYAYILYSQPPPQDHLSTACTEENHLRMFSFHLIRTCLAESTVVYSVSQHFVYCVRLSDVVCLLHAKHESKQQECMNTESVFGCSFVSVGNTIMCSAIYRKLKHIHLLACFMVELPKTARLNIPKFQSCKLLNLHRLEQMQRMQPPDAMSDART